MSSMSIATLTEKQGTILPPRMLTGWRDECVLDAFAAVQALAQGAVTGFAGVDVTDHHYFTRTGSPSCSPPV